MTEQVEKYEEKSLARYSDFDLAAIKNMVAEYQTLTVPEGDDDAYKVARKALTTCVRTRTAVEKHRKSLGRDLRDQLADINSTGHFLIDAIAPAEQHLSTEVYREKNRLVAIANENEKLKRETTEARVEELSGYLPYTPLPPYTEIESMSDGQFQVAAKTARFVFDTEQERIADEKRVEDERVAKVAADQAAVAADQATVTAELAAKQAEIDAKEKAIQDEKDKLERVAFEIQVKEDAKVQAEIDAKAAAEKAEAEKKALAEAEAAEAKRIEDLKPDRERALDWIDCAGQTPEFPDVHPEIEEMLNEVQYKLVKILDAAAEGIRDFCNPHDTIGG
jgi:hypothetical protein